jgi:hypothetical protein
MTEELTGKFIWKMRREQTQEMAHDYVSLKLARQATGLSLPKLLAWYEEKD